MKSLTRKFKNMKAQSILRLFAALSFSLCLATTYSQVSWDVSHLPASDVYEVTDMPTFPGGRTALSTFLAANLKYPAEALERGVEGSVVVEFTIGEEGCLEDSRIVSGLGYGCDEEVLRLIEEMPCWEPGTINKQHVACTYTLRVRFSTRPAL